MAAVLVADAPLASTTRNRTVVVDGPLRLPALKIGLLNEIVPRGELPDRLQFWISRIEKRDSDALRFAKQAIDQSVQGNSGTGIELVMQANLVRSQRKKTSEE